MGAEWVQVDHVVRPDKLMLQQLTCYLLCSIELKHVLQQINRVPQLYLPDVLTENVCN